MLPLRVELAVVHLPGREQRFREPAIDRMETLVDLIAAEIRGHLDLPFAFFGHSLGARIAFELTRRLRATGCDQPVLLYVSASSAPQLPRRACISHLPDDEFVERLSRFGGMDPIILAAPELLDAVLPALRADFTLYDRYVYNDEPPLDCPIVGFAGRDDPVVAAAEVDAWRFQTNDRFELRVAEGGHFLLRTCRPWLLASIGADFTSW
jgi:surfactin synthase thioesterase subunit